MAANNLEPRGSQNSQPLAPALVNTSYSSTTSCVEFDYVEIQLVCVPNKLSSHYSNIVSTSIEALVPLLELCAPPTSKHENLHNV
jgi:hypothetical protein